MVQRRAEAHTRQERFGGCDQLLPRVLPYHNGFPSELVCGPEDAALLSAVDGIGQGESRDPGFGNLLAVETQGPRQRRRATTPTGGLYHLGRAGCRVIQPARAEGSNERRARPYQRVDPENHAQHADQQALAACQPVKAKHQQHQAAEKNGEAFEEHIVIPWDQPQTHVGLPHRVPPQRDDCDSGAGPAEERRIAGSQLLRQQPDACHGENEHDYRAHCQTDVAHGCRLLVPTGIVLAGK